MPEDESTQPGVAGLPPANPLPADASLTQAGFFRSLFDLSFKSLITPKIIKVLYLLSMIVIGLIALSFIVSAFATSAALGVVVLLIGAPLVSLLYLIATRVYLELVIALFRIMENTTELVAQGRRR